MREYATIRLREANEADLVEERCLDQCRARWLGSVDRARYDLIAWLAWVDLEIDNIRAVLQRCIERGDLTRGLDIAASLGYFWITRGTTESVRWLDQLLAAQDASPETEVRACFFRGWLSLLRAEPADARPWLDRAVTTARQAGLRRELALSLSLAATTQNACGDASSAARLLGEAASLTTELDAYPTTIELLQARAVDAVFAGATQEAGDLSTEGVRLSEAAGDIYYLESFRRNLASVAILVGDLETAKGQSVVALRLARDLDNRVAQYYSVCVLGWHASTPRQPRRAAQLLGAAAMLGIGAGADLVGPFEPFLHQAEASAISALDHEKYRAEFLRGRGMSRESALRSALG